MRALRWTLAVVIGLTAVYLLLWPVPVDPVAWDAPRGPGFTGQFARNDRLAALEILPMAGNHGPETIAVDAAGRVYAGVAEGRIIRLDGSAVEAWVDTRGRPLGLKFDHGGNLLVADAYRGLLRITPSKSIEVLATEADGIPFRFTNSVDIAADGKVYFTDSSSKFGAREFRGTYSASLLDLLEHGGHGRLLVYDPTTRKARTLVRGLNFANGVAIAHDGSYVLVAETGSYRILRYWIEGGRIEPLLENLPGFPDNLSTGMDGRYWVAFASPRNKLVDALSNAPFVRKMAQRLPAVFRPKAVMYGHVAAFDGNGRIVVSLQDPKGRSGLTTGATETRDFLYVSNLEMPSAGRMAWP